MSSHQVTCSHDSATHCCDKPEADPYTITVTPATQPPEPHSSPASCPHHHVTCLPMLMTNCSSPLAFRWMQALVLPGCTKSLVRRSPSWGRCTHPTLRRHAQAQPSSVSCCCCKQRRTTSWPRGRAQQTGQWLTVRWTALAVAFLCINEVVVRGCRTVHQQA